MRSRYFRLACIATGIIAAAGVLAACGTAGAGEAGKANAKPPILIGISLSLTGGFSADGQAFKRGYQLWQGDVNSHGGLLGRQVKLIILDDKSSPTKVVTNYQQLITADHVDLTFGPFSSLLTEPASAEVAKYGYAMIEGAGDANSVFYSPSNEKYHNVISPSLPVELYMKPFIHWILKDLPANERPRKAAYPSADDPFATPAVQVAQKLLQQAGIKTVYSKVFNEVQSAYTAPAQAVAASGAQIVVLGSTDVPTVATFMKVFEKARYTPKVFIAVSGPDQGSAFLGAVGLANADGMMVPGGWYGAYSNALSNAMVEEYIANYGGTADGINADVAEAFSVGEVAADAIRATQSVSNAAILRYLHSGVTLNTVQGLARFNSLGENPLAAAFVSQWQSGQYVQVLPVGFAGSKRVLFPKPAWGA